MEILPVPFYYIRHGQTDWNRMHRAMGKIDIPLNDHGVRQAIEARNRLLDASIQTICYSPLARAKKTAEILNEVLHCQMVAIDELQEFNLGNCGGQIIGQWFEDWRLGEKLPNGELYSEFQERSIRGVNKALDRPGITLIVAHGGTFWSIEQALRLTLNEDLPNCIPAFYQPPGTTNEKWTISLLQG
jgi:broad specificity phosphatase PhoE